MDPGFPNEDGERLSISKENLKTLVTVEDIPHCFSLSRRKMKTEHFLILIQLLYACLAASNQLLRDVNKLDSLVKDVAGGVLGKNGKITSCDLAVIDSRAAIVAASCLDYTIGTALNTDTSYTALIKQGSSGIEETYAVYNITVHSKYNPYNYVNNLAIIQFNPFSTAMYQNAISLTSYFEYQNIGYLRYNATSNTSDIEYIYIENTQIGDKACEGLSEMYTVNVDDVMCNSNTINMASHEFYNCKLPMGSVYGYMDGKVYALGLYSHTAISKGDNLCNYGIQRSYFTTLNRYIGFIQQTINRTVYTYGANVSSINLDTDYTMVDRYFSTDEKLKVTTLSGDLYRDQANAPGTTSTDHPEGSSTLTNDTSSSALGQKTIIIIAVCASVGGLVVALLAIAIVFWWCCRKPPVDPVRQKQQRDIIESEIGGAATVDCVAENRISQVNTETVSRPNADLEITSLAHEHANMETCQHADLPPAYDKIVHSLATQDKSK
ncbi:hypothetical protein BX667DRAFT_215966 [Coemansia mojavensis]|nr:hypothetical protein BX667DRAFT_215966 [Coemansia mojavensis]